MTLLHNVRVEAVDDDGCPVSWPSNPHFALALACSGPHLKDEDAVARAEKFLKFLNQSESDSETEPQETP